MKFIGKLVTFIVKLALLAAALVMAMEALDAYTERSHSKYLITEDLGEE